MARSVFIGIASASIALALTASIATPSMAMSFNDYDGSAHPIGSRADVSDLFSGRLLAAERKRDREERALTLIRSFSDDPYNPLFDNFRPTSFTLPFADK